MISLQTFDKTDFSQLVNWIADAEALMQFAGPSFNFPLTTEQLELSLADKKRLAYKVIHLPNQTIIGHAEIYLQDAVTAVLCRILIGDMAYRGLGLGQQIVNELLILAFSRPGIKEAMLNVFDWNMPAVKCYEKAGFLINEGKTKTRQVNNQTWVALNMRLEKSDWKNLQKTFSGH
jgi:RimJ/RimL family protein N-acetyltransferase